MAQGWARVKSYGDKMLDRGVYRDKGAESKPNAHPYAGWRAVGGCRGSVCGL